MFQNLETGYLIGLIILFTIFIVWFFVFQVYDKNEDPFYGYRDILDPLHPVDRVVELPWHAKLDLWKYELMDRRGHIGSYEYRGYYRNLVLETHSAIEKLIANYKPNKTLEDNLEYFQRNFPFESIQLDFALFKAHDNYHTNRKVLMYTHQIHKEIINSKSNDEYLDKLNDIKDKLEEIPKAPVGNYFAY